MTHSIVPRDWKTTNAVSKAKKQLMLGLKPNRGGKQIPAFNNSQTDKRNKKRPITLPKHA